MQSPPLPEKGMIARHQKRKSSGCLLSSALFLLFRPVFSAVHDVQHPFQPSPHPFASVSLSCFFFSSSEDSNSAQEILTSPGFLGPYRSRRSCLPAVPAPPDRSLRDRPNHSFAIKRIAIAHDDLQHVLIEGCLIRISEIRSISSAPTSSLTSSARAMRPAVRR